MSIDLVIEEGRESTWRPHGPVEDGIDRESDESRLVEDRRGRQDAVDQCQHVFVVAHLGGANRGGPE